MRFSKLNPTAGALGRAVPTLLVSIALAASSASGQPAPASEEPSRATKVMTFASGAAGSWAIGLAAYKASERGRFVFQGDSGHYPAANTALLIASPIGAALGVWVARTATGRDTTSWGLLLGAALGGLPLILERDNSYLPYFVLTYGTVLQTVGAMLGADL